MPYRKPTTDLEFAREFKDTRVASEARRKNNTTFLEEMKKLGYDAEAAEAASASAMRYDNPMYKKSNQFGIKPDEYVNMLVDRADSEKRQQAMRQKIAAERAELQQNPLPTISAPAPAAPLVTSTGGRAQLLLGGSAPAPATPAPATPAPAAPKPVSSTGSILPDVLSERTQDIGKSVDQKFTDKLAEDKKAAQVAQDARIANLPTIQTPYGAIKATPEQAARFNKSPEMVQIEIDELRNRPYRKPVTDEEIKNLSDADFERRLKESMTPITRQEIQDKNALYESLQRKRNKLQEEARDERFLRSMDTLRKNRQAVMDEDRKKFASGEAGDKAFAKKWDRPEYRSVIDQPSAVSPGYTGKTGADTPDWFKAYQNRSVSISGGGSGISNQERASRILQNQSTRERLQYRKDMGTSRGIPAKLTKEEADAQVAADVARNRAAAEAITGRAAQFGEMADEADVVTKGAPPAGRVSTLEEDLEELLKRRKKTKEPASISAD